MTSNHRGVLTTQILNGLEKLRDQPGFLIVQIGDYYVQFRDADEPGILDFEAVSNEYLPEPSRLSEDQTQHILSLGFNLDHPAGNFYQQIAATETDCFKAAETSVEVFYDVYLSSEETLPVVELTLQ